ncbi:Uncharacterised protein [Chlamydia abortus]|nr:Uncharacterised protein [Chlamydia abortus]
MWRRICPRRQAGFFGIIKRGVDWNKAGLSLGRGPLTNVIAVGLIVLWADRFFVEFTTDFPSLKLLNNP